MRNPNKRIQHTRRSFMAQSACSALGLSGIVSTIAHMKLMRGALAANIGGIDDYKALTILFQFGGTDMNNCLIPDTGHNSRTNYENNRGVLTLPTSSFAANNTQITNSNTASGSNDSEFALHPVMTALADIFNDTTVGGGGVVGGGNPAKSGHASPNVAFCANVGSLVVPTRSTNYNSVVLPPQLFSHSDQQNQWQSSLPDKPFQSGWSGRIADLLNPVYNELGGSGPGTDGQISMSVSLAGINDIQIGLTDEAVQYAVTTSGAVNLNGYNGGNEPDYFDALSDPSDPTSYKNTGTTPRRLKAFQDVMNYTHAHLFENGYNDIVKRARENEGFVGSAITEADSWIDNTTTPARPRAESIFLSAFGEDPNGTATTVLPSLAQQLLMIVKLIAGRKCLGNKRQLFFCSYGGHDTHQDQGGANGNTLVPGDIDANLTVLSNSLAAYNDALLELELYEESLIGAGVVSGEEFHYNDCLLATHSDFNRTFTPNGNNAGPSGSDHAWGTHTIVMGGDVHGGSVYGYYPDLAPTGAWGTPGSSRGRWIPTSAVEQYTAPLAAWLGIDSFDAGTGSIAGKDIETIFPNLNRFANPFVSGAGSNGNFNQMEANANMDFLGFAV
ncbi:MAG: DUF1501 domain-containing protein [Verrucomicrobiota bacterium]